MITYRALLSKSGRPGNHWVALPAFALYLLMSFSGCTTAPEEARNFKTLFDFYRDKQGITAISFPPGLVGIVLSEENPEQAEIKRLMQQLSSFRMLVLENGKELEEDAVTVDDDNSEGLGTDELKRMVSDFTSRNEFQDLFRMQTGSEDIFIRIQEKEGVVTEAIMMMDSGDSFFVIDLRGNISLKHFTKLVEGGYLNELTELSDISF